MLHSSRSRAASIVAVTFVLTLVVMQADAQVGPPPNSPPTIVVFGNPGPNPTVTVSGTPVDLPYFVIGNPSPTCSIDNGVGTVPCSGNADQTTTVSVSPTITTTYTLTATNSYGTVTAQTTVIVLHLPPNPPGPGLLTSLPGKHFTQVALPPQSHYTFAALTAPFVPTHSGDLGVSSIAPGNNVDAHGNMLSTAASIKPPVFFDSTAYLYDPNGVKSIFGATTGSCTQSGPLVANDYTLINRLGYNPVALAYYITTIHAIQTIYTNDPSACNRDSSTVGNFYYYFAGSATQALIKVSSPSGKNPGDD